MPADFRNYNEHPTLTGVAGLGSASGPAPSWSRPRLSAPCRGRWPGGSPWGYRRYSPPWGPSPPAPPPPSFSSPSWPLACWRSQRNFGIVLSVSVEDLGRNLKWKSLTQSSKSLCHDIFNYLLIILNHNLKPCIKNLKLSYMSPHFDVNNIPTGGRYLFNIFPKTEINWHVQICAKHKNYRYHLEHIL